MQSFISLFLYFAEFDKLIEIGISMDVFHNGIWISSVVSQWFYEVYCLSLLCVLITGVIISLATSWSKLALICSFQLYGTGIGVSCAYMGEHLF